VHDLDPQDQPQYSLADTRRPTAREHEADLSALDDEALVTEARREALRDQRQERSARAEATRQLRMEGRLEGAIQLALVVMLFLAIAVSIAITISGLLERNEAVVRAGLLALCAMCGGTLYRLGLKG
jgi:hypothetical protein